MKKTIISVATIGIFAFAGMAIAKTEPSGDPFLAVWNAINEIKLQIANIQLTPGPKGDKGDTGEQGIQGIQGEKGEQGPAGSSGNKFVLKDGDENILGTILDLSVYGSSRYGTYQGFNVYDEKQNIVLEYDQNNDTERAYPEPNLFNTNELIYFEGANCVGRAFKKTRRAPYVVLEVMGPRYFTVNFKDADESVEYLSFIGFRDSCTNYQEPQRENLYPMIEVFIPSSPKWPLHIVSE